MGGADHFRVERTWRDSRGAVAFARDVVEVSISVNYMSWHPELGMSEHICQRMADEMGVSVTLLYRE